MLDPDARTLLSEALCPPLGYVFDEGVAATYSLSLETLLTIPLHLVMQHTGNPRELAKDSVALLESLRRFSSKLTVYCNQGQIHVPASTNILYSLLEPVVYEVRAPGGGAFHPKFWVLRFTTAADPSGTPLLRLLVLSRNLTFDRSWDIGVTLEGIPGRRALAVNGELADLVGKLPSLVPAQISKEKQRQAERLAAEVRRTDWQLPSGFDEYSFRVLGLGEKPWEPRPCKRLLIVSPFCSEQALRTLADSASESSTLISLQEQLDTLPASLLGRFTCFFLDEAAETGDGEVDEAEETPERQDPGTRTRGLHAKVQMAEKGWVTRLTLGSANATDSAIVLGNNVEILVGLAGKTSVVNGIERFLGSDGFGDLLQPYEPNGRSEPPDLESSAIKQAQEALSACRRAICSCGLKLDVQRPAGAEEYELVLTASAPPRLGKISELRAWPVTVTSTAAVDGSGLQHRRPVRLPVRALSSMCGFIAFQLTCDGIENLKHPEHLQFVLNLPIRNLPSSREAEIVQTVIRNRDGFLRYLFLLLGDLEDFGPLSSLRRLLRPFGFQRTADPAADELPILEHLVRAYSRDPERLRSVKSLLEELQKTDEGKRLVPEEFTEVWRVFDDLLSDAAEPAGLDRQPVQPT